jgi:hypothetical protein
MILYPRAGFPFIQLDHDRQQLWSVQFDMMKLHHAHERNIEPFAESSQHPCTFITESDAVMAFKDFSGPEILTPP